MTDPLIRDHTHCRACGESGLVVYLDLGEQPLANAFLTKEQLAEPEFTAPLSIARCPRCGLSQLTRVVDPEYIFRDYAYASGHAQGWRDHCAGLAMEIRRLFPHKLPDQFPLLCDIACNDGTLLQVCRDHGIRGYGVDPALNLNTGMIPVIRDFWGVDLAYHCLDFPGRPDVIVAQNVLGHVDDVHDFLTGIAVALAHGGVAIIECPHIHSLLMAGAFDTIYHEHLSYWSLTALIAAANRADLRVVQVQMFPAIHGGTCRYYLRHAREYENARPDGIRAMLDWERRTLTAWLYRSFAERVTLDMRRLHELLQAGDVFRTYAFGASAKSTVLLNTFRRRATHPASLIQAIFDDTPAKHGKFTPGVHLSVRPVPNDMSLIDTLVIGSANWADELKAKAELRGFRGRYIIPWHSVTVEQASPASPFPAPEAEAEVSKIVGVP